MFTSLASPPPPPPQPTVTTRGASAVTQTAATLNATVNPNGETVSDCHFEYGTTMAYGSNASCTPAPGWGASAVAVSASIAGLAPGTAYHFRIVATGPGGNSSGVDGTFTTAPVIEVPLQQPPPTETAPTPGGQGTSPFVQSSTPPAPVALGGNVLAVSRLGSVAVKLTCHEAGGCAGTLFLRSRTAVLARVRNSVAARRRQVVTLATGSFSVTGGTMRTVRLRLSVLGRRLLAHGRRLPGLLTIAMRVPLARSETVSVLVASPTSRR
jgi:hypothetical protein